MPKRKFWTRRKARQVVNSENVDPILGSCCEVEPNEEIAGEGPVCLERGSVSAAPLSPVPHSETASPKKKKSKSNIKRCLVPKCGASEANSSNKIYFCLSKNATKRNEYSRRIGVAIGGSYLLKDMRRTFYICSDHYAEADLEIDPKYSEVTGISEVLRVKNGVLPSLLLRTKVNDEIVWRRYDEGLTYCHDVPAKPKRKRSKVPTNAETIPDEDWPESLIVEDDEVISSSIREAQGVARSLFISHISKGSAESMCTSDSCGLHVLSDENESDDGEDPDYSPSVSSSGSSVTSNASCAETCKQAARKVTLDLVHSHTKLFLGVEKHHISLIDSLARRLDVKNVADARLRVLLVLRKVRLNESYDLLGLYFGLGAKTVSEYFRENIPTIAACMEELIFRPDRERIVRNMPQAFRFRYHNVDEIIDGMEIEIEKPSNSKCQNATFSAYKHCNTLKLIVAISPDGYITFISVTFGGRVSDVEICRRGGYLKSLRKGMVIMADRGFKHLLNQLIGRLCKLVRPPSVTGGLPLSETECMQAKQIASLRIHVERAIGRLRLFAMLAPHARLNAELLPFADFAVRIAAGLCNLGNYLIKV